MDRGGGQEYLLRRVKGRGVGLNMIRTHLSSVYGGYNSNDYFEVFELFSLFFTVFSLSGIRYRIPDI